MSQVEENYRTRSLHWSSVKEPPLRQFRRELAQREADKAQCGQNVGRGERWASVAAGSILGLLGVGRRGWVGLGIAGIGAALVYRGATGHCSMYKALGIDTTADDGRRCSLTDEDSVEVSASFLINKPAEKLYTFWRNFENLPKFMGHLQSVHHIDDRRSHWVAKAPKLYGGQVEWDAEIVDDQPNTHITWRSLDGSDVEHRGTIRFTPALGDRGTQVTVQLRYAPPAGIIGRWTAKLFGEEPKQQIHDDLRNFKRLMETGELLTIDGQPVGTCTGKGKYYGE